GFVDGTVRTRTVSGGFESEPPRNASAASRMTTARATAIAATNDGPGAAGDERRCVPRHDRVILRAVEWEVDDGRGDVETALIRSITMAGADGRSSFAFSSRSRTNWLAWGEIRPLRSIGGRGRSMAWRTIMVAGSAASNGS